MITLTAKISLLDNNAKLLATHDFDIYKNNISTSYIPKNKKVKGSNPFILGSSKLGDGTTFSGNVDYAISRQLSDENGNFSPSIGFNISFVDNYNNYVTVKSFSIAFDTLNNRHPKTIQVGGVTYEDDDPIFFVDIQGVPQNGYSIVINNWNTPNAPLVITGIYLDIEIEINNRNLISLDSSLFDRGDTKLPSFGIISNTGNLEFNDLDGEIRDYAEQLLLQSGLKVQLNLTDTLRKTTEQVALMETGQWDYDNNNRVVSVSLKDDLEEWQDIQIKGFNYDPRNPKAVLPNQTLADLYKWLQSPNNTPTKYDMLSFGELDSETQEILNNTYLPYPLLNDGTLWEQWQKVCQVCELYIYKNGKGRTVCSYTYGS